MSKVIAPMAALACFLFIVGFSAHRRARRLQEAHREAGQRQRDAAHGAERAIDQSEPAPPASS